MCTASWIRRVGGPDLSAAPPAAATRAPRVAPTAGWFLAFNRDESRARPAALPPELRRGDAGVRFLAPIDPAEGGTWIAVNEFGLALALLNNYQAPFEPRAPAVSRGRLVLALAECSGLEAVEAGLRRAELDRHRGFHLLVLPPGEPAALFDWAGRRLERDDRPEQRLPLISSGYDLPGVRQRRLETFRRLVLAAPGPEEQRLRDFQASTAPPDAPEPAGAYAVRMSRPDARTVSQTEVFVESERVRLRYRALPEDPLAPLPDWQRELSLPRAHP